MPYHIGRGNCVIETNTGKVLKCHNSHGEALAHLRALELNVMDASVILMGTASFEDNREERLIRFKNATLARVETNANGDVIEDSELDNLVETLAAMPIDIDHKKTQNIGTITAARRDGQIIKIDGYMWPHRIAEYGIDPIDVMSGKYKLSIEADALAASCSVCGKTFRGESEYCDHLQPENKMRSGAKRFFKKLRGMGAAITQKPAGTGAGFETRNIFLVAHMREEEMDHVLLLSADANDLFAEAIDKRKDISKADKERAVKEYGDVKYADEKNKKYPIDTEEHIRAAWNYAHQARNAAKYSSSEIESIRRKIAAAWKDKIDKSGPPSAADGKNESKGEKDMTLEELNAALDAKLNPIAARLDAVETTIKANQETPPDDEEKEKEMMAAVAKVAADKDAEYQAKMAELEAKLAEAKGGIDLQASQLKDARTEMLRLKLVNGGIMTEDVFDKQKGDLLNTPESVLESMVASFNTARVKTGERVWVVSGKIETPADNDYQFEV